MAKNEDGEFELILGNRQLISVFLIVVILLGVFFSMGYIVGRNSAPVIAESGRESRTGIAHTPPPSDLSTADSVKSPDVAPASPEAATPSRADTVRIRPEMWPSPRLPLPLPLRLRRKQNRLHFRPRHRPRRPSARTSHPANTGKWWPPRARTPRSSPRRSARKASTPS